VLVTSETSIVSPASGDRVAEFAKWLIYDILPISRDLLTTILYPSTYRPWKGVIMQRLNDQEIAYLNSQMLGRLATADAEGQPHATPVGFRYDEESGTIVVGGIDLASTKKARDIRQNPKVAFVVDDLESIKPWRPRGITIRGTAILYEDSTSTGNGWFGPTWIRIIPNRVISWGLNAPVFAAR
jgi:pyridoxamine 5'-phosphate oxidase family protein